MLRAGERLPLPPLRVKHTGLVAGDAERATEPAVKEAAAAENGGQ